MYLTAQRVQRPADGATAIHAFLHVHDQRLGLSIAWTAADVMKIADESPGRLIAKELGTIPQGGNRVMSYLDIVCEDGTGREVIDESLRGFRVEEELSKQEVAGPPVSYLGSSVAALFWIRENQFEQPGLEYLALREAVNRLARMTLG